MKIKLSKRLKTIAKYVNQNDVVADIGSDHAHLPLYLFQNGVISKAYAIDNKTGPFLRMMENVSKYDYDIKLSLSDGISMLESDVNTLVIAGMGAKTILNILSKKEKLLNIYHIIIDSHNDVPLVRKEINKLGYIIKNEEILIDKNIYYIVMDFKKGNQEYSEEELYFGPILLKKKDEVFLSYHKERLEKLLKIVQVDKKHQDELTKEINMIKKEIEL